MAEKNPRVYFDMVRDIPPQLLLIDNAGSYTCFSQRILVVKMQDASSWSSARTLLPKRWKTFVNSVLVRLDSDTRDAGMNSLFF
jgi:hypothetical protein